LNDSEKNKQTINVENLKEALVGQMQTEVAGLDVMSSNYLSKNPNEAFTDMSSLLESITSGHNETR
jgi:hypothetical protein